MRRPFTFLLLAAMAAVLAAVIVLSELKKRDAAVQKALASSVEILVAAHDLPLGTRISADDVRRARWSSDSVPAGAFTDPQALSNSVVKSQFAANEPIVANKLFTGESSGGVMPLLIPSGMRAMSVPVDEVSDIAGFVQPRTHVDILLAISGDVSNQAPFSRMVLQNVEVLAVAQEIEGKKDQPEEVKVVTLLVTPADAEKLALAEREGTLRLAMRNFGDQKTVATGGVSLPELLHGGAVAEIRNQQAFGPVATTSLPRRTDSEVSIRIMRDGKSEESLSFIHAGFDKAQAHKTVSPGLAYEPTGDGTSAASATDRPDNAPSAAAVLPPPPMASLLSGTSDAPPNSPGTAHTPEPKTIDIP